MKSPKILLFPALVQILIFVPAFSQDNINSTGIEKRLALVIGNSKYTNSMELANPVNDARAMKSHGRQVQLIKRFLGSYFYHLNCFFKILI